jgi:hypothetical protein
MDKIAQNFYAVVCSTTHCFCVRDCIVLKGLRLTQGLDSMSIKKEKSIATGWVTFLPISRDISCELLDSPVGNMTSDTEHNRKIFPTCEVSSHVFARGFSDRTPSRNGNSCTVYHPCETLYGVTGCLIEQMTFHIEYNCKVSPQCEFSDGVAKCWSQRKTWDNGCTETAFLQCEFLCVAATCCL